MILCIWFCFLMDGLIISFLILFFLILIVCCGLVDFCGLIDFFLLRKIFFSMCFILSGFVIRFIDGLLCLRLIDLKGMKFIFWWFGRSFIFFWVKMFWNFDIFFWYFCKFLIYLLICCNLCCVICCKYINRLFL